VLVEYPVDPPGRNRDSWAKHILTFRDLFIDDNAAKNQAEYLRSAKKPKDVDVKVWIRQMRTINNYLPYMVQNVPMFTEDQPVRHYITPSIPNSWKKDFKLG